MLRTPFLTFYPEKLSVELLGGYQLLDFVLSTILLEVLLPELDVDFSVPENMMTDAKNGRLEINNAIKCNILNKAENALSEKKNKLSSITELLPYGWNICTY